MPSFHVMLASGEERDVKGASYRVDAVGSLVIVADGGNDDKGPYAVIYAPGTWNYCEPERRDDTG